MAALFFIYIIYTPSYDKFYVGRSADPWKRLKEHNNSTLEKFTGKIKDWELAAVFRVNGGSGDADKLERIIKKQESRAFIIKLITPTFIPDGELAQLVRVPHVRK